ncbi:hypothetical protein [Alicyclobacillus sp. ALC3]|uniref:hypothetical protein n=1 Tax=Alicyclobacillus sp. ALC3 TaxID=2796143 RepID=UPI002377DA44|nr:hypothetical protein [Alicyclobacillus sp. ALC3]WDL96236.1 hypothetical protein JC200_18150 [Alicyclobacillus sp. ALC3]
MSEWTWLHAVFPLADVELTKPPLEPQAANVLVRTVRRVPESEFTEEMTGTEVYELRVAPHNVAPFRGGPWRRRFVREELETPGAALSDFRERLAEAVETARSESRQ